jgi:hypothetical protein
MQKNNEKTEFSGNFVLAACGFPDIGKNKSRFSKHWKKSAPEKTAFQILGKAVTLGFIARKIRC